MTTNLPTRPEPLTPPDLDLRWSNWFPLHHKRLRRSAWWLRASDSAKAVSIELWCEAYEQVPAASLPNDDVELSVAAGFGRRDIASWLAIKDEVMSAWVLCSDGRWYHPTLAEVAIDSVTDVETRRKKDRERKARQRENAKSHAGQSKPSAPEIEERPTGHSGSSPATSPPLHDRTEHHRTEEAVANATVVDEAEVEEACDLEPRKTSAQRAVDAWNEMAQRSGLSPIRALSEKRRAALKARLAEHGLDGWGEMLRKIEPSSFLNGGGATGWVVSFDFAIKPTEFLKIIEGKYDDRPPSAGASAGRPGRVDEQTRVGNLHEGALEAINRRRHRAG